MKDILREAELVNFNGLCTVVDISGGEYPGYFAIGFTGKGGVVTAVDMGFTGGRGATFFERVGGGGAGACMVLVGGVGGVNTGTEGTNEGAGVETHPRD